MEIQAFINDVLSQNREKLKKYFAENAVVLWRCTNERFTVEEYIRANCDYPGKWDGEVEKLISTEDGFITAVRVFSMDGMASFHVTSFITLENGKITFLDEYWADDGEPPEWRKSMNIGKSIK